MPERNLDFDICIDRYNTRSLKYDFAKKFECPEDAIPMWVADMDFRTSSYVEDAIIKRAAHNIYGYSDIKEDDGFFEAVSGWMLRHHNFKVEYKWLVKTPGVCSAIVNAVRVFTKPGDAVIIQQPVYYPFSNIIVQNHRKRIISDLVLDENGHYSMDFEDFEKKVKDNNVKLFILCNPQNPVGRVWTRDELQTIGNICKKYGVLVFSDEIHFDFDWINGHHVFQEVDDSFKEFTITATAPSKTFNLAGLQQSNIFIPNEKLRQKFATEYEILAQAEPNVYGIVAAEAAYRHGDEWYEAMTKYVRENIEYTKNFVNNNLTGVRMIEPEGTYLVWLDYRDSGIAPKELDKTMVHKAKVWLDAGEWFGNSGKGFTRMNVACPRKTLMEALERMNNIKLE